MIARLTVASIATLVIAFAGYRSGGMREAAVGRMDAQPLSSGRAKAAVSSTRPARYEPSGLCMLRPYTRGKIPVVLIHGLLSSPRSWDRMVAELEFDPTLANRYQFWTFSYSSGDPVPYIAFLLRRDMQGARKHFDPDCTDLAFEKLVFIGHGMGGILSKMMVQASEYRLWSMVSSRPVDHLAGDQDDRDCLRQALIFEPQTYVSRIIFLATPHRGSSVPLVLVQQFGSSLVRDIEPFGAALSRLIDTNQDGFFRGRARTGLPKRIDELTRSSSVLEELKMLPVSPKVALHSIIADRTNRADSRVFDGLISYASAHIESVASEMIVASDHFCQENSEVIHEIRRILSDQPAR